jgi:hypothetical protein
VCVDLLSLSGGTSDDAGSKANGGEPWRMETAQIGASGVLLIQYKLLKRGIDSSPMTTDDGIDLVVYSPAARRARAATYGISQTSGSNAESRSC